jgi:hypothetical protein
MSSTKAAEEAPKQQKDDSMLEKSLITILGKF